MKKFIRKLFTVILLAALVFTGIRFGPALYARIFGGGNVQWISERFSETLKEKNHLVVYEVETTGQETVTQDAWLFGTVQKVVVPYTFQMSYTVDLSRAAVSASRASSAGGRVRCSVSMVPSGVSRLRQPMKISSIYTEE
mgnify:CR=1 FL=1